MSELSVIEYAGRPIAAVDRYSGGATTYQDVVSWTVPTGKAGVVFEASIESDNYALTEVRLQFQKNLTGALTFTSGSAAVTGSSTLFSTELAVGDIIILDADETWSTVLSIESNTALTLGAVYAGTGGSGASSEVWGFQDVAIQSALTLPWNNNKLAAGIIVKWQAQSTDGTTITVDGSITGKTLEYE